MSERPEKFISDKFICDRMLGKLATWLRISGYDTLYVGDFSFDGNQRKKEDTFMLKNYTDRILLTRDRELYSRCLARKRKVFFIHSDYVADQIRELKSAGIDFKIVMNRCSVCNGILRKPEEHEVKEVLEREGISEDLSRKYELWYCPKCIKLYWMGSHWKNMVKFLKEIDESRI